MKLSGKWITIPLVRRVIGMPGHQRSSFNSCVGLAMSRENGKHKGPTAKGELQAAFSAAAKSCRGKHG